MKHFLTIAALLALSSPVMAQEAATAPATPPVEAAAPAAPVAPAEQPPVILFRQVTEVPIRPEEIEVDGRRVLHPHRRGAPLHGGPPTGACASPGSGGGMSGSEGQLPQLRVTDTIGWAVKCMENGHRVCRPHQDGDGKEMFLFLVPGSTFEVNRPRVVGHLSRRDRDQLSRPRAMRNACPEGRRRNYEF